MLVYERNSISERSSSEAISGIRVYKERKKERKRERKVVRESGHSVPAVIDVWGP